MRPTSRPRHSTCTLSLATLALALLVLLGLVAIAGGAQSDSRASARPLGSLVQPRGERGCIHRRGTNRCAHGRRVTSPEDVVVSPDGRFAYVASYGSHAIAVFRRQRPGGYLTQLPGRRGCVHHRITPGRERSCTRARALGGPVALALSPDGRNLYAAAAASDTFSVFARNARTGVLRQLSGPGSCLSAKASPGCLIGRGFNEPTSVAVSPDGGRVYVTGRRFPSAVAILRRAADGTVTQPAGPGGCVSHLGGLDCAVARGLASPEEVTVTPDGRHVLVAGSRSHSVVSLTVVPEGLVQAPGPAGCIALNGSEQCASGLTLRGTVDLAVSANGRDVYAAASLADGIAILRRDRTTGALSQARGRAGCISQDASGGRCRAGRGLDEVWGIALSPDGRNLYAVSSKVNMLSAMARDRASGRLTQLPGRFACFIRGGVLGCPEGRGLTVAVAVTVSPDGRNVYVASEDAYLGAVAVFRRLIR